MDIDVFPRHELPAVFRVLRTALATEGPLNAQERLFLRTYARIIGSGMPVERCEPIAPGQVQIGEAHARKRLLQLAALAVLLSLPVKNESLAYLKALSTQLATFDPVIDVIEALRSGRHLRARMLALRRAFRAMFKEAVLAEGVMGAVRLVVAMLLKGRVNTGRLWDYKRLGLLPDGTLGREYWKHMVGVGFGFPGEPAGIPYSVSYHDIGHVLAEHEATPLGEIQQGSFQGGNRREDGFFFIQFVILQFHHGVRITPGAPPDVGHFDPEKLLWAIHRGAKCHVDMTHQWDYWPLMALPLAEARARCGLIAKLPA